MSSLPARTPAIVRRHPALLVEWLRLANQLSRWREEGTRAVFFVVAAVAAVVAMLLASLLGHAAVVIETLARYWLLVGVVSAIYAFAFVSGRRRTFEESQSQSWLIATPISPSSLRLSHAIRTLLPLVVMFVAIVIFALAAGASGGLMAAAGIVIAAIGAGLLVGGAVGWWAAGRAGGQAGSRASAEASRYVPRPRAADSLRPDAAALSHWPIAQVLAWSRPENSRYVLIAALLAVQGGSSAIAGLSVVAMYFVASYLAALLSAMLTVSKQAATWLRSTPMTLQAFVLTLSRRALAHQLIGTALAVVFMVLLGAPVGMALEVAGLWLGLVVSISGFALVDNYRGQSPAMKIALSIAAFAALAAVAQLRAGAKA